MGAERGAAGRHRVRAAPRPAAVGAAPAGLRIRVSLRDRNESEYLADLLQDHGLAVRVALPDEDERGGDEQPAANEIVVSQELVAGLIPAARRGDTPLIVPTDRPAAPPVGGPGEEQVPQPGRLTMHDLDAVARRLVATIQRRVERNRRGLAQLALEDEDIFDDVAVQQSAGRRLRLVGREGVLVCLRVSELGRVRERLGAQATWELVGRIRDVTVTELGLARPPAPRSNGELLWVLPAAPAARARKQLEQLGAALASRSVTVTAGDAEEHLRITPAIGLVGVGRTDPAVLISRARAAAATAASRLDLEPCTWEPSGEPAEMPAEMPAGAGALLGAPFVAGSPSGAPSGFDGPFGAPSGEVAAGLRGFSTGAGAGAGAAAAAWRTARRWIGSTAAQALLSVVLAVGLPYLYYTLTAQFGVDVLGPAYAFIVLALVATAGSIYVEGLLALDPVRPPALPPGDPPPATVIIAAYLPNESATIIDTLEAFLRLRYAGSLQVILAYNTPHALPVESVLQAMAHEHPRLVVLRVPGSTSKAQNVNAALEIATGHFTGVFDADHHPAPDSVTRAWRWLADSYDIVQGHCVIRNGGASWLSRMVAVEFESMYAVGHPGRAKLHGFGIFGGSNGYWRTDILRRVRMRPRMLTEDIDSSVRSLLAGVRIASDPALLSFELAPTTLRALTRQRLRWAQGWFQVSRKYFGMALASPVLNRRQKAGAAFLFGWRELYPWISIQIFPLLGYLLLHPEPGQGVHWAMPFFLFLTLVTMGVGVAQSLFAYLLAHPDVRRRRRWFLVYALFAGFFYTEYKNGLARVAQIKEIGGERQWRVTPRQVPVPSPAYRRESA
ncbi:MULTISPECIES: glycosyltransferase family 2 protein [Frankia]|uniref:N-acetylglucosaminyltransferase n=1 Tax=Frankia alni (strain DSM 45986 / CECT 9034 / ACN14a) TaxID=326424 RepID=Q0RCU7_FRAAA|nr:MULTISPECIES: glycosyltransferase [Frankia]CAJ64727.1 putative N-acetylglucosaminyltransferase [Frankia alni ACN14a]